MGTLLFDFDEDVRELRYVVAAVWIEGTLEEAFAAGAAAQEVTDEETDPAEHGGVSKPSEIKTKRAPRGWWALSTSTAGDSTGLPWNAGRLGNQEAGDVDDEEEEEDDDEDEELYLAETEEQLKDLDDMVYAAAEVPWLNALLLLKQGLSKDVKQGGHGRKRSLKVTPADGNDWDSCVDRAVSRGKERLKEHLVERFPFYPSLSSAQRTAKPGKTLAMSAGVNVGTTVFDSVRQEERRVVGCTWVEPGTLAGGELVWGSGRGAGGCASGGGWAIRGELSKSLAAPSKKQRLRGLTGSDRGTFHQASEFAPAPPLYILYPAHTVDDRVELDNLVAAAKARASSSAAATDATAEGSEATAPLAKRARSEAHAAGSTAAATASEARAPGNRPLGPLVPARWAKLSPHQLLELIPMQSLAQVAVDAYTYRPFLEHVRTKAKTASAAATAVTSSSSLALTLEGCLSKDWQRLREALAVAVASAEWLDERESDFEALVLGGGIEAVGRPRLVQLLFLADDAPSRPVLDDSGIASLGRSNACARRPNASSEVELAASTPLLTCLDLSRIISSLSYGPTASAAVVSAISRNKGARKRVVLSGSTTTVQGGDAWNHHVACRLRAEPLASRKTTYRPGTVLKDSYDMERSLRVLQAAAAAQVLSADEYWKLAALVFSNEATVLTDSGAYCDTS